MFKKFIILSILSLFTLQGHAFNCPPICDMHQNNVHENVAEAEDDDLPPCHRQKKEEKSHCNVDSCEASCNIKNKQQIKLSKIEYVKDFLITPIMSEGISFSGHSKQLVSAYDFYSPPHSSVAIYIFIDRFLI